MKKEVLVLKKVNRYKGIHVTPEEIELLRFMFECKTLFAQDIHMFYRAISYKSRTSSSITKRLNKLVEAGIFYRLDDSHIKRTEYRPLQYFYRIATRGLDLLVEKGFISEEEAEYNKAFSFNIKMPGMHNKSINSIVTQLAIRFLEEGKSFDLLQISSRRGDRNRSIQAANEKSEYYPLIPDWVFETKNEIICIELDTGTQSQSVIFKKFERYKRLAELLEKPLTLVFSVGLELESKSDLSNRDRRVHSLKECFPMQDEWPEGLNIYVVSSFRTVHYLYHLISRKRIPEKRERRGRVLEWMSQSIDAAPIGTVFIQSKKEHLERLLYDNPFDMEVGGEIRIPKQGPMLIAVLHVDEGAVRCFQRIRVNMKRLEQLNRTREVYEEPVSLFLIYEKEDGVKHDVLGLAPVCDSWSVSMESVNRAASSRKRVYPPITQLVTQFTKKEGELL